MIFVCLLSSAAMLGFLWLIPRFGNYLHQVLGEERIDALERRLEPVLPWFFGMEVCCIGCFASLKFGLLDSTVTAFALGSGFGIMGFLAAGATIQDIQRGKARSAR